MINEKLELDKIKKALTDANGFVSVAAKNLNCDTKTIYNYMNRYPELKELLSEIRNKTLDYAESKLLQHIENDNFNALKFFLETQGKQRGYTVRTENVVTTNKITIDPEDIKKIDNWND